MTGQHWSNWHDSYDQSGSSLHVRLAVVQRRIREALASQPPGPINIISMCAGQGRDLLETLVDHPRRGDVRARLVELDPHNTARASAAVREAGLDQVDVLTGDASCCAAYEGYLPADIALVCGVFGNVSNQDIEHTIKQLPRLCRSGATVIWTRHRKAPDVTPRIRNWFASNGYEELGFDTADGYLFSVGTNKLCAPALPYQRDLKLFEFIGDGTEAFL